MLKMLIDNEEVVSNNSFTIKEEMLSASSTILNNTYPKTWEQDHDYTSRFYYPKDYSKMVLTNETYYPHIDGTTIEGTNFQINADTTLEDEYYFKGNTTQNGTPTPSTPIPIEVVTGNQEVNVCGKNLFSGLVKGKGINSVNGIETTNTNGAVSDYIPISFANNQGYYLSGLTNTLNSFIGAYNSNKVFLGRTNAQAIKNWYLLSGSFTNGTPQGTGDIAYIRIYQHYISGNTGTIDDVDNLTPQLEKGNQATTYEPYIGNTYSINLGKNLIGEETITVDKAHREKFLDLSSYNIPSNEIYTFSFTSKDVVVSTSSNNNLIVRWYDTDSHYTQFTTETIAQKTYSFTFTPSALVKISFVISSSVSDGTTITLNQFMLEKGSIATEYSPYFPPIELCKIGTYQDRIFKNTLTSPYYDSNLELDKWYLYKEIGKTILTGASDESWGTGGTNTYYRYRYLENFVYEGNIPQPLLCNQFKSATIGSTTTDLGFFVTSTGELRFREETMKTIANWKTFISNNPLVIYYVLATPTCNEITNTTLINELESIRLLNGLNNISITSANLSAIMNLHYNFQTEHTTSDLIFSGIVKNTNNISLNPRDAKYCSLEILDYKTLLSEGNTLDYVISNKTITEAITMVVNSVSSYGFELGNINILNGNDIIGAYSTENKTAYDVLQYLADISGAKWNCRRKDDTTMYIDFYDPTLMPRGKQIEYTNQWGEENNLVDIKFNYGTRDYRNKQIIISDEVVGDIDYIENLVGDSVNTSFLLGNNVASITSIIVNGENKTVATETDKTIGIYADFYYKPGSNEITSNSVIPSGTIIKVTYKPVIKGREVITNDDEITRLSNQLDVNGVISRYESRNDETDSNKLLAIGETYLRYKGEAEITLTIQLKDNDLYNVGQMVYFNAPIQELARDYLVKSKQILYYVDGDTRHVFYTYTLSSSFNAEREINWFDNQRNKNKGNIAEGEFISRNIDISSTANIIWDNLTITEINDITGNNELNATLNAPLNE